MYKRQQYYQTQGELEKTQKRINEIIKGGTELTGEYVNTNKQSAEQIEKIAELERELEKELINKDEILQDNLAANFELYNQEGLDLERKEELRKKIADLLVEVQNTSGLSQKEFLEMADTFELSADDIIKLADDIGLKLDEATRSRLIDIKVNLDDSEFYARFNAVKRTINELGTGYMAALGVYKNGGALGGIVKAYSTGGIIASDGAYLKPMTAAGGLSIPQTGREVPIIAHEYEVIANTSQQKNVADWFWKFINNPPEVRSGLNIDNFNVITPKGTPAEIAQETKLQLRLLGMEAQIR